MILRYGPEELNRKVFSIEETVQKWADNSEVQNYVYLVARKGVPLSLGISLNDGPVLYCVCKK